MNLFVYVLLLSIWTNCCLDTNHSDGSPTTGAKHVESTDTKLDSFWRLLLVIIISIMIIAFVCTCFYFIHYNCLTDDAPKAGMLKKEGVTAKAARPPSKMSSSDSKTPSPCSLGKQSLLSSIDKLSSVSSPEKSPIHSSAEWLSRPSSPQNQCTSSSIPKVNKPSSRGKKRPSCSDKKLKLFHLEKFYRTRHLGKPYKPAGGQKLVGQAAASDPNKAVSPPWSADLQYIVRPTLPLCPPHPQNHISPPKQSCVQKLTKSLRRWKLKRSVCGHRADVLYRPQLIEPCQYYKERCLVCRSSEPLVNNISEAKNRNAQNPLFTSEGKPFTQSCLKADYRDNVFCGNVNGNDIMTYENEGSDREVTTLCNMKLNKTIPKGIQDN